jgi:hypothetical protein
MGNSISQRTAELLERRRREGRLCNLDRPHIARATVRVQSMDWPYPEDRLAGHPGRPHTAVFCPRCFDRYIRPWLGVHPQLGNVAYLSAEVF